MIKTTIDTINNSVQYAEIYENLIEKLSVDGVIPKSIIFQVNNNRKYLVEWQNNIYLQITDISVPNKEIVILYRYDEDCGNEFYYANKSNVKILFYSKNLESSRNFYQNCIIF